MNNSTISIQKNGSAIDSFTTNEASAKTINIPVNEVPSTSGASANDVLVYDGSSVVWDEPPIVTQASITYQGTYYEITDGSNLSITDNTTYFTLVIG